MKRLLLRRELGILVALLIQVAVFTVLCQKEGGRNTFLNRASLTNVLWASTVVGIAAIGGAMVIISGGIDLSVGSVIALSCVVTASLVRYGPGFLGLDSWEMPEEGLRGGDGVLLAGLSVAAAAAGIAAGLLCGLLSGLLVVAARLPPFIATLGMMGIARGLAQGLTRGNQITMGEAPLFLGLGQWKWLGIVPASVVLWILATAGCALLMSRLRMGRQLYALGGNEEAARFSGVPVERTQLAVYAAAGALAGLAGVVYAGNYGTGDPAAAMGYELDVIAAAVVGGASLSGGRGSVAGALMGTLIFSVLRSGLNRFAAISAYKDIAIGGVLILVVITDQAGHRFSQWFQWRKMREVPSSEVTQP